MTEWIPLEAARNIGACEDDGTRWVVLARPDFDPNALAEVVARAVGMPRVEATIRLKKHWGMIHRAETAAEGEASIAALAAAGFEAFLLPESARSVPPEPADAEAFAFSTEGVRVSFRRGEDALAGFGEITLLGAGRIDDSAAPTRPQAKRNDPVGRASATLGYMAGGVVGAYVGRALSEQITGPAPSTLPGGKRTKVRFLLEVATRAGAAYRVESSEIRAYEPLREKVAAISAAVPGAVLNRGARAALTESTAKEIKYDSEEGYEAERRWLWQIIRRG